MTWIIWGSHLATVFAILFAFHFAFLARHFYRLWQCMLSHSVDQDIEKARLGDEVDRLGDELIAEIETSADYESLYQHALDRARRYREEMDGQVDTDNFWRGDHED